MPANNVFRWRDGRGWLVLSGGATPAAVIRAQALTRASADGAVACIWLSGAESPGAERTLDDLEDLGGPAGYLVDVLTEDDDAIETQLSEAGIVVIDDQSCVADLRSAVLGAALRGIEAAFDNGALILAEGAGAALFGAWILADESSELLDGLGWLERGLVVPGVTSVADSQAAQNALQSEPDALAVGLGVGSALALGPDGDIEVWGHKEVAVALGPQYGAE